MFENMEKNFSKEINTLKQTKKKKNPEKNQAIK